MAHAVTFYRSVLRALRRGNVPFLIGGFYAMARYTRMDRRTKDLDLMIQRENWPAAAHALRAAGIYARLSFPHWLGKALGGPAPVDIIFNSGNGNTPVDAQWFSRAVPARVLGFDVELAPPEELLWSKAFVMERERFDGADVLHLIVRAGASFDWEHLCKRFEGHERVLLAHVLLFGYAYPADTANIPSWVPARLASAANMNGHGDVRLCRGTLLSREQYLVDIEKWGYADGRLPPFGKMRPHDAALWTQAIHGRKVSHRAGPPTDPA